MTKIYTVTYIYTIIIMYSCIFFFHILIILPSHSCMKKPGVRCATAPETNRDMARVLQFHKKSNGKRHEQNLKLRPVVASKSASKERARLDCSLRLNKK